MSNSQLRPGGEFVFNLDIDKQSIQTFCINLVEWSQRNPGVSLRINVNSSGGVVLEALALFDTLQHMRQSGHHLTMAVYGRAASAAAFLLQAADVRLIGEQSWLLIHQVSSSCSGTIWSMQQEINRCIALNDQAFGIICARSDGKLSARKIRKMTDVGQDWWITASEAVKLGLVDEIERVRPYETYNSERSTQASHQ